ncbi:hypothetical protein KBD61_05305 [Patescibacteria group bacterium]|nr:hypothetical protein [Patescibacteria group bacterium]MBP9710407.1 hypothetical protein [Patescibacteria group bacterium]
MSATFFRDLHVVSDLLAVCQGEGWLTPKTVQKTRVLLEHGLHPEQALIGTGLMTPDQYGEALTHMFDIPFTRRVALPRSARRAPRLDADWLVEQRAVMIDEDVSTLLVAFADPSDAKAVKAVASAVQAHGLELVPAVTLWSDVRPAYTPPLATVSSIRRQLQNRLDHASTSHVEIGCDTHGWHVSHQSVQALDRDLITHSPASAPALAMHLLRHRERAFADWSISHSATSHGAVLTLKRQEDQAAQTHPLDWSQAFEVFTQHPEGMLIFVASGQDLVQARAEQQGWLLEKEEAHWRTQPDLPAVYQVEEEEYQEEAVHAALSGRPVVAYQKTPDVRWAEPLQYAHIPVSILQRHVVPNGMAWTSRSL